MNMYSRGSETNEYKFISRFFAQFVISEALQFDLDPSLTSGKL